MKLYEQCYICRSKRDVPGNCHIACTNPDPEMTGNSHGIKKGWFLYPILFDPIWGTKECNNFSFNPIGLTEDAVIEVMKASNLCYRIVSVDDKKVIITSDYISNRYNLSIKNKYCVFYTMG